MIRLKINRVDYNNNNTPILSKIEIEKYAREVLADYKPHLLKEPGSIGYQHFLENYLELTLLFRDIYNENPKNPVFGALNFDKCTVKVFDRENERIKAELMPADSVIIDNFVTQSGREGMANFNGAHEGAHYLIHSGITFPAKTRRILCHHENVEDSKIGSTENRTNKWIEFQANYFAASFTMFNGTFIPLVNDYLRKHNIWTRSIKLGVDDDLDILGNDLLPEYIAEIYDVSKQAAFNKLKTTGFIDAQIY